jgi:hypothetical protein
VLTPSVDRASAIALLHDHTTFQNLQPLVVRNEVVDSPPSTDWLVTEAIVVSPPGVNPQYRAVTARVPFGPFGSRDVTTISAFVDTEDGLIIVFQAPMGLHGKNEWKIVTADEGEGFVLLEEAKLTGYAPLMPFIAMTETQSHTELGVKFALKLGESTK